MSYNIPMPELWSVDDSFPGQYASRISPDLLDVDVGELARTLAGGDAKATWIRLNGKASRLPETLGKLTWLRALTLRVEPLGQENLDLGDVLAALGKLEFLEINSTRITALPRSLASLPSLRAIEFLGATVSDPKLFDSLAEIPGLEHIALTHDTRWSGPLPASICELKALRSLEIGAGAQALPASLGALGQLEKLVLVGSFSQLPADLAKLGKLRKLELRGDFTRSPAGLAKLDRLESLQLQSGQARVEIQTDSPGKRLDPDDLEWASETFDQES
jgi:hypothetical protein